VSGRRELVLARAEARPAQVRRIPSALWTANDGIVLALGGLVGLALVATGAYVSSHESVLQDQIPWINLAVVGALVLGVACTVVLLRGRRAVAERRAFLLPFAPGEVTQDVAQLLSRLGESRVLRPTAGDVGLVTAAGMRFAHRATCPLVVGKSIVPATSTQPRCGVCGT
jgi:hypothetical protein